jgi:sarcosine oxidase subunit gamma
MELAYMPELVVLDHSSPFGGLLYPVNASHSAGVRVSEPSNLQLATVIARRGREALSEQVSLAYGLQLPAGPKRSATTQIAFIGVGPRTWMATRQGGVALARELQGCLGDTAAVSDQSGGYATLRLSGPKARATFAKGVEIDLHPTAFRSGDCAVTTCSHLGVILWQLDEVPTYEVALFRSLAPDFWHWLATSGAEFGITVGTDEG